jgi:hypothetical protein
MYNTVIPLKAFQVILKMHICLVVFYILNIYFMLSPDFVLDNGTISGLPGQWGIGAPSEEETATQHFLKYFNISYMHVISQATTYMQSMFVISRL